MGRNKNAPKNLRKVRIYYQNLAGIPQKKIAKTFKDIQALYGSSVVFDARPLPAKGPPIKGPYYSVVFSKKAVQGAEKGVGGQTSFSAHRAYVYPGQVDDYGPSSSEMFKLTLAHELGHLFGLKHSNLGFMQPHFNSHDLTGFGVPLDKKQISKVEKVWTGFLGPQSDSSPVSPPSASTQLGKTPAPVAENDLQPLAKLPITRPRRAFTALGKGKSADKTTTITQNRDASTPVSLNGVAR